jgi:hypothetical protein
MSRSNLLNMGSLNLLCTGVHDLANIISIVRLFLIDIHLQKGFHATLTHHNRGEIYAGPSGLGNRLIGTFGGRGRYTANAINTKPQ